MKIEYDGLIQERQLLNVKISRLKAQMVLLYPQMLYKNITKEEKRKKEAKKEEEKKKKIKKGAPREFDDDDKSTQGTQGAESVRFISAFVPPTVEEVSAFANSQGWVLNAQEFLNHFENIGWHVTSNSKYKVKDWRMALYNWHAHEDRLPRKRSERKAAAYGGMSQHERDRQEGMARLEAAKKERIAKSGLKRENWQLCAEECSHFFDKGDGKSFGCSCGIRIPPPCAQHPHPPQECPRFSMLVER